MRSIFASLITIAVLCLLSAAGTTSAFVTPSSTLARTSTSNSFVNPTSTTQLHERQWNFNEGQGPFGLKKNAEIWNGRVAQMGFVLVFIQELVQGKGCIDGLREGDPVNIAVAAGFAISVLGLTAFLAIKGKDDYVDEELKKLE